MNKSNDAIIKWGVFWFGYRIGASQEEYEDWAYTFRLR